MHMILKMDNKKMLAGFACAFLALSASVGAGEPEQASTTPVVAMNSENSSSDWRPPPMPKPAAFGVVNLSPETVKALEEDWGVKVLGLRLASANYMMDFRFRVLDVEKSLTLFDQRIKPHLIVDRSQIKLPVPMAAKIGAFRPTNRGRNIKADKNYYMMFGNPDRHVKAGETVTIVIGDFRVEHLVVN